MTYFITHIKDSIENNYLGLEIPIGIVEPFLNELKDIIGEDDYNIFTENQKKRDNGRYHLTVINVSDYNQLTKEMGMDKFINSLENIFKYPVDDIKMMGVGTAQKNENRSYFVVCQSDKLEAIRKRYELPDHDFHITLGFKWKDVFGVRKNELIEKKSKFLKLLAIEYYKNENWNFIKRIDKWDFSPDAQIEPISLNDRNVKFKVEGHYIDVGLLDNEEFKILTKYPIDIEKPTLSQNELAKIFKQVIE
jgi:hypothetical protein